MTQTQKPPGFSGRFNDFPTPARGPGATRAWPLIQCQMSWRVSFLVRSRVRRPFCFALLCDSLSFACPKESKQRKRTPEHSAGAKRRFTATRSGDGMRTELGSLWRSSDMLYAPAQCAGHPSPLRVSVAVQRARIQTPGHRENHVSWQADFSLGLRSRRIRRTPDPT